MTDDTDLRAEVAALRAEVAAIRLRDHFEPFYSPQRFSDRFRGTQQHIKSVLQPTVELLLTTTGTIVDVGAGQGELVQLLVDAGRTIIAVEPDPRSAHKLRADGFDVRECGALEALATLHLNTDIGAVSAIQVIEHLSPQTRVDFILASFRALKPHGMLVLETVNPMTFSTYAQALYLDPTHTQPIHPLYLVFVMEEAGFVDVRLDFRSEVPAEHRLTLDDFGPGTQPSAVNKLNQYLFGFQDYAVIGRKP